MLQNFFKFFSIVFLLAMFTQSTFAQTPKSIPGDYATIEAAISDLNTNGVPAGGVTFNVAAGHTETFTSATAGIITATGTLTDPVVFQKSGAGANPLITAFAWTVATAYDGMIKIAGGDYITFDGIDLQENAANTTIYTDWGYALVKASATAPFNGAQFVTIKNCVITLNKANTNSVGIYSGNHIATATTSLTITDPADANSNNKFFSNSISNCYSAISISGFAASTPFALYDQNNEVGVDGANTITNFGGSTVSARAIYAIYQNGLKVNNNNISSDVTGTTTTVYGIFISTGTSSNIDIVGNTVALNLPTGTYTSTINGINNAAGSTAASNTINISNNIVQNCNIAGASTGSFTAILNSGSAATVNINNNTVTNNSLSGTGTLTGIDGGSATNLNMVQNTVNGNQKTGASGSMFLTRGSTAIVTYHSNNVYNNSFTASSGTSSCILYGYYNFGSPTVENIYNNNFYNLSVTGTNTATGSLINGIHTNTTSSALKNIYGNTIRDFSALNGTINGIAQLLGTNVQIYKNNIYNLSNDGGTGVIYGISISSGIVYAYNNFISDLKTPTASVTDAIRGINVTSTTTTSTVGLYHNTILLSASSTGINFGTTGIYHTTNATATTAALDMRNNIVVNTSTPAGTGLTVAYRRSSTTLTNYASVSNNNAFYAGTPSAANLIFFDGTNSDQLIDAYKSRVTPRDANSFSENVTFVNSTTAPYDLHINPTVPTQIESGGTPISTPVTITDDFEGELRSLTTPDIGADEFTGTGLDLTSPNLTYTLLANTSYLNNRQLTVTITDPSGVATSPNGPVLYYKKSTDVTFVVDNAPTVLGDNYTFTINYANLSGVVAGEIIQYYVAAMDLIGNSGTSPAGGSGTPPGTTPPATFNSYTIVTASSLPYTQDFNAGTTLPAGWGGTMSVVANHGTTGSNGLTRNLYSSVTTANAISPIVGPIESTTQLEFDFRIVDYSSYPGTATVIGASDVYNIRISTDDGATFTTVYTINQANHVVSTNFATVTVPLGAYAGFNGVIRWDLQWGAGDYYFDIDNVIVRVPPVGPPNPAVLVSPANGGNTVSINTTLNWASGGGAVETGYRIYFGTDGGGVTPPTDIANNVDLGLVTLYTPASPLAYATTYYWQIVPYNGSGNAAGNEIWSFTTGPNPDISTFPYTQDFEGTLFPPYGFTNYGTKSWTKTLTGGVGGTAAARVSYTPAGTANLQTPDVILPVSPNYRAKFWWKDNDIAAKQGDGPEIIGHDTTYFEISTDGGSNWTILSFLAAASSQSSYVESVNDLTPYAGQTVVLRWRDVSNGSFSAYGTGLDNILIEEIPAGPIFGITPASKNFGSIISGNTSAPQNFTISNMGAADLIINSGDITLTGADADQFILGSITYPITVNPGGNAVISAAFSPTGVGIKSANLQIVHNAPGSPSTVALSGNGLPLGVLFEDFTNADALARWKTVNLDGGVSNWYRSTGKFNSSPASAGCDYEPDGRQNNDWLISPKLEVVTGDSLTFYHSIQSTSYPETFVVKVGTTTNDPETGTWVDLATIVDNTTAWKYKNYDLSAYAGQQIYVAFVYRSTDMWTVFVDDITGPVVYVPAVDLAFTDFYQSTGLPVPKTGENFVDYRISTNPKSLTDSKPFAALLNSSNAVMSSDVNNTIVIDGNNSDALMLNNVSIKAFVKNFGLNAASYNLGWNVDGVSQTPFSGPSVLVGATDSTVLTYTPTARGTFITSGNITVTADENPDNNLNAFRMRVYPDVFTRTSYDRGDNIVDTWVGWGATGTTPFKAGVRYTATSDVKLAGVDFIYNTEALTPGEIMVQVRAAGTTTSAPGAVLYTAVYNTAPYFPGGGDYIHLPFGDDAPAIASGSDYWITVKVPLGAYYPGGVHNTGFTAGRSYFESSTDSTLWNPLVITTERAWIMRSVEVAPAPSTFQLSVNVLDGWNMTSVPGLHPDNQNVNTWWPNRNPLADVYKWNGSYTTVPLTNPTEGYWMLHTGAQTYNTGDEWPAGGIQFVAHDPIALISGWNMIGGYENILSVAGLTTTPPGLIVPGTIYGWNGTYFNATTLEPGYGYWVLTTGAGVINTPTLAKESPITKEDDRSEWGKITIADASGKSYVLYSVNGDSPNGGASVNLDHYLMPPLPPTGCFDVRYSSNRKAENLKEGNQAIEMRGLIYPVTVRVENENIKLQDETGKLVNAKLESGNEIIINNSQVSKLIVSENIVPDVYSLEQNYPNPFNPSTVIEFSIPDDAVDVRLTIYNALGQKVTELVNTKLEAGKFQYKWDASDVASGLYIYELRTGKFNSVKKMLLLK